MQLIDAARALGQQVLSTNAAAQILGMKPQSLRAWACKSRPGPIRPVKIGGRLGWRVDDVARLVGEGE
ncbi:helix-turn-helix domain-containing protein [Crenobacter luteus]|uniref:helix-turn-helix domain-containing protein n=1 Tax=Crenobacter luteus TaxID=1452487 RepID=UPI00104BBFBE|nr:helix-turn-helix domain-containing protein [Crenobacter luteus]